MKYLFTSDWHLRYDRPICRTDDFLETQKKVIQFIFDLSDKHGAEIIIAGDLFHKARPENAQELEVFLMTLFNKKAPAFIAGNHDLLYHRIENAGKGSYGVVNHFNRRDALKERINFVDFGRDPEESGADIMVIHIYCEKGSLPEYIDNGIEAEELLRTNPQYKVIVTGDNHNKFTMERSGRLLFNPGCITRQEAGMKNYRPSVILYDEETSDWEEIFLPDDDPEAVSNEHIVENTGRDERIQTFINQLSQNVNISLSFEDNLKRYCKENEVDERVTDQINKAMEEV